MKFSIKDSKRIVRLISGFLNLSIRIESHFITRSGYSPEKTIQDNVPPVNMSIEKFMGKDAVPKYNAVYFGNDVEIDDCAFFYAEDNMENKLYKRLASFLSDSENNVVKDVNGKIIGKIPSFSSADELEFKIKSIGGTYA